ncbi:MAG: InlB B-repeat-containing protein [Candidatus Natronoplasma sp.]
MGLIDKLNEWGIPGFRSKTKWKMIVGAIGYLLIFIVVFSLIVAAIIGPVDPEHDPETEYELNIDIDGEGSTDPEEGTHSYDEETELTVEATPADGWEFVEWTGDETDTDATIDIIIDEDISITAVFEDEEDTPDPEEYDLTINIEGEGSTDPEEGTHTYEEDTDLTVEATPADGWEFVEWTGDETGTDTTIDITMDSDIEITANFEEEPKEAEFEVSNLQVEPSEVEPGETVTISVDVENVGDAKGSYDVELKIDGTIEETKTEELEPQQSTSVSFQVTRDTEGTYQVEIDELTDSFDVIEPAPEPIIFEGSGDDSTETFDLVEGVSRYNLTHDGESNFIVELMESETGDTVENLVNEIGSFDGSQIVGVTEDGFEAEPGEHLINVEADGDWKIVIEQPKPTSAPSTPQTYSDEGYGVPEPFELDGGTATFEMSHDGESNFIVQLYDKDGNVVDYLANEIGEYEGTKTVSVSEDIHYLDIEADGNWDIEVTE